METMHPTSRTENFWEERQQNSCPLCEGIGFQLFESNGQTLARKCRCLTAERIASLQQRSGIPDPFWNASLEGFQSYSLQEAALVDLLKSYLAKKDIPALQIWVPDREPFDAARLLLFFANDLIRVQGYSTLWLDCIPLAQQPARTNPLQLEWFDPALARNGDFLFIQNFLPGLLKAKMQSWLEETLLGRLHRNKSTFFVGPRPEGVSGHQNLFLTPGLGITVLKKFKELDSSKGTGLESPGGWLF
jgi:hypothetical protein